MRTTNPPSRPRPEDVLIKVGREVERTLPRLETALVRAWDKVRGRIDKFEGGGRSLLVRAIVPF